MTQLSNDNEFSVFWAKYPRRIGKLAAIRAYSKARRQASASEILDGIDRYIATKPTWQEWAHPSSWLNAGRWMDEAEPRRATATCGHEPRCVDLRAHQRLMVAEASGDQALVASVKALNAKKAVAS